ASNFDGYVNPPAIGKTLPNPFRCAILSEEPLTGYEIWFDKADGGKTKRIAAGDYPSDSVLAEYEKQIGGKVAYEVDFETRQPTDRKAIKKCAAFFIYDYEAEAVKVLSYTSIQLLRDVDRLTGDPDYEDLSAWDLQITKTTPKVSYSADMKPALRAKDKAVGAKVQEAWDNAKAAGADIWRLTDGGNPFSAK
ncbi:hypothetical protein EBT31_21955, partial [bacterium]|nr:hypothetical protein [bacterium]